MRALYVAGAVTFSALTLVFLAADEVIAANWAMNHSWSGGGPVEAAHAQFGHRFAMPISFALVVAGLCITLLIRREQSLSAPNPSN